jgi:hypothetical protein
MESGSGQVHTHDVGSIARLYLVEARAHDFRLARSKDQESVALQQARDQAEPDTASGAGQKDGSIGELHD